MAQTVFTPLKRPMEYLKKYLESIIQVPRDFVFLHQQISKISQLEETKPSTVQFKLDDFSLHIKTDSGEKVFPFSSFEKFEIKTFSGTNGDLKYISINIRGDKYPIILHGPIEVTELWYDGFNSLIKQEIATPSSLSKSEMFTKAVDYGNVQVRGDVEIPPLPDNYNFVSQF